MMGDRKIVQFQCVYGVGPDHSGIYALADDGTFWQIINSRWSKGWRKMDLPPLPQDDEIANA